MERQTLQAEVREERGKGPARQLRMKGQIPAVLYGPGIPPKALSVTPKELVKALTTAKGRNAVIALDTGEGTELCMVREVQAHPVTGRPLHVDFYRVDLEREVKATVPFGTTGRALGVQRGGRLKVVFRELPISARPDSIPEAVIHDVSPLDQGERVTVGDLVLPEGVRVLMKPERNLVLVEGERAAAPDEEEKGG